jgi:hypothetical protein
MLSLMHITMLANTKMNDRSQIRRWMMILAALFVLLPGFPILMIIVGCPLAIIGLDGIVFMVALRSHNLYYSLPAALFGKGLFPSEEFGYLPTSAGITVAAILYAMIALALSFPLCWMIGKLKQGRMGR